MVAVVIFPPNLDQRPFKFQNSDDRGPAVLAAINEAVGALHEDQSVDHADMVGSTSAILKFAKETTSDTVIVATEPHIIHQMEKALPNKTFIGAPGADGNCSCNICPYMALNTMEKLYVALRDLTPQIEIEEGMRLKAKRSLDRMLEMAGGTVGMGDLGKVPFSGD